MPCSWRTARSCCSSWRAARWCSSWPRLAWVHLPAAVWGAAIEFAGFICPLTPLEKAWRRAAGGEAYQGDFIEHYVTAALYPSGLTRPIQIALGVGVLVANGWVYWTLWRRRDGARAGDRRDV